jgi:hypothetical protein
MARTVSRPGGGKSGRIETPQSKALGPAAAEFGDEIRPLGREVGAVTVRAVRALLRPVGVLVWGFEQVEDWIAHKVAPKIEKILKKIVFNQHWLSQVLL